MTEPTPIDVDLDRVRLLNRQQVARALGVSHWTVADWTKRGLFPQPLRLTPGHASKWRLIDLERWLERQARKPPQPVQLKGRARSLKLGPQRVRLIKKDRAHGQIGSAAT